MRIEKNPDPLEGLDPGSFDAKPENRAGNEDVIREMAIQAAESARQKADNDRFGPIGESMRGNGLENMAGFLAKLTEEQGKEIDRMLNMVGRDPNHLVFVEKGDEEQVVTELEIMVNPTSDAAAKKRALSALDALLG